MSVFYVVLCLLCEVVLLFRVRLFVKVCVVMVLGRVTVEKEVPLRGKGRPKRICKCDSLLLFLSDTTSIEVLIIHTDHA